MRLLPLRRLDLARASLLALPLLAGCGNWSRVGEVTKPNTQAESVQMLDPTQTYLRLGRLVSPAPEAFVGSVAFLPGHGDSTASLVGLSLSNRDFAFEREGTSFRAKYRLEFEYDRAGAPPIIVGRNESIVVATFKETLRTDESIILQQQTMLVPGDYTLSVRVRDLTNTQTGGASKKVSVPAFPAGSISAPILAYRVRGRATRDDSVSVVLNPRGTVSYGGDTLLIYIEGTQLHSPTSIPLQVRDERDSVVLQTKVHFEGTGGIEGRIVRLTPDSAPLGQLQIILGPDAVLAGVAKGQQTNTLAIGGSSSPVRIENAIVSFSNAWVVTNFDDLLSLLRYFGHTRELDAMKRAKNGDRVQLWAEFSKATDPNPSTPENEALDQYFSRLSAANQLFREQGFPGWKTDRGEVYITFGPPDENYDQSTQLQNAGRVITWIYADYARLSLTFQDLSGFGRFTLTPQSRSDFESTKRRVKGDN